MKSVVETITPKKAAEWLTHNEGNRPVRNARVKKIAEAMKRGEWQLNGEAIKFNCNGRLADGQHRLHGVVESGITIKSLVVYGLPENAFDTLDQIGPRTIADVFARNGEVYYQILASAVRWVGILHHKLGWKDAGYTPDQAKEMLAKHAKLRESAAKFSSAAMEGGLVPAAMAVCCHYLFSRKDAVLADAFVNGMITGTGLKKSDPVYLLRERMIRNKGDQAKLPRDAMAALIIKAWNATRLKTPMRSLKWTEGTIPEVK